MRKAFNFFHSYYDVAMELNDKDRLAFYDALLNKQFNNCEPTLSGMAKFAYLSQKHSIDTQVKGYFDKTKNPLFDPSYDPCQGGVKGSSVDPSVQEKEKEKEKEKEEKNDIDINKDIILPKNKFSEDVYKVFEHTVLLFKEEYRPSTESQKNNWLDCIDKLNRIDGMEYREIYKMVKWGLEHDFWNKNFYTILKLRKKNSEGISYLNVFKSQMEFETKQVKTGSISTVEMIKKMAK